MKSSHRDFLLEMTACLIVFAAILTACYPAIASGEHVNLNGDFFQYASRHEQVRQALLKFHTFPQRTMFFGGGFPTIGDPEDPTFNPLIVITMMLGTVKGLKWIGVLSILFGAFSLYWLARDALGYGRWGAVGSALFFGLSLWLPTRIKDGNFNEVYYSWIPACLFCLYRIRYAKRYLLMLAGLFIVMLSDGKLTFFVSIMYIGVLFCSSLIPGVLLWKGNIPFSWYERFRPIKWLTLALALTFLLYLFRILPAIEVIETQGSLARMQLFFHAKTYSRETIHAYSFTRLWQETIGWHGRTGLAEGTSVCIGWVPLTLACLATGLNWRRSLPWVFCGLGFAWLMMANRAPFDLFAYLWNFPIFNSIASPAKYFGCLPVLSVCVLAGQGLEILQKIKWRWIASGASLLLVVAGVQFLYPKVLQTSRAYNYTIPHDALKSAGSFYQVRGLNLKRNRTVPWLANTYVNLVRGIGTIDWYTGIPIAESAVPRYFVTEDNQYVVNPEYRGECFLAQSQDVVRCEFLPNRIGVEVVLKQPDTLIINQNFHAYWSADKGQLHPWNNLLAVQLPAGKQNLQIRYLSRSLIIGLLVSFFNVLWLAAIAWNYHKGRFHLWQTSQSRWRRVISKTILRLVD